MFNLFKKSLFNSRIYDEKAFFRQYLKDLAKSSKDVLIESPFITSSRMEKLYPVFEKLIKRKVRLSIVTRDPVEHEDEVMRYQATNEILQCCEMGITVKLLKGHHHRKLSIIDKSIVWEGSLNILSFCNSREFMRRIEGKSQASELLSFLKTK